MSALDYDRFVAGHWPAEDFAHRRHVEAAHAALSRLPFLEACIAVRDGIRLLAATAGAPQKYNETITVAAMSLVAERMDSLRDFAAFASAHPELMDGTFITRRYSPQRLQSPRARRVFLLPDRNLALAGDLASPGAETCP